MRDGERGDDRNERTEAAKGDHQAEQKQQMVGAVENVEKTQVHEAHCRLVPPRIEVDEARIAVEFERANSAAGRQKSKNYDHAQAQPRKRWVNGKLGLFRLDRVLEQHAEHGLIPIDVRIVRKRRPGDVRIGIFIRNEGAVRRKRDASRDDLEFRKASVDFVDFDEIGDP